ncbi:GH92 family glycosyl hydrolase [Limibacter armeniacum]|uniref:GH92 family glycosyl hydrolase n=1 Tax=Limibacter armeniacum TaxID=466084 RepID=UPI002FE61972
MKRLAILGAVLGAMMVSGNAIANPGNIARQAKATASNFLNETFAASNLNDGIILKENEGEWACEGAVASWGVMYMPWAMLEWDSAVYTNKIRLYDRPSLKEHTSGGTLVFSDGSKISVTAIPNDGAAKEITFPTKKITWVKFEATDGDGKDIGLSEFEVYPASESYPDLISWVDPYIETTRGRWFFCTPAATPMGMVAAAAYTRNKNQGGGGYNYNSMAIRGFNQLNDWMISGVNVMPVTGEVTVTEGEEGWKSPFKHENEVIQPGYHKLYLDRYKTWVEYTASERVTFYRMNYQGSKQPHMLLDLGSKLGNATMHLADMKQVDDHRIVASFKTTDRFWGGPDNVDVYCVVDFDQPIQKIEGWKEGKVLGAVKEVNGDKAGMDIAFADGTEQVLMKIGVSYTSIENAVHNLETEVSHWNFDQVKESTQQIWNEQLAKVQVKGGSYEQNTKFYTDLWHVLLGRHKINDVNGAYPDYTGGEYVEKRTAAEKVIRKIPQLKDGSLKFNMYSFDALWLTQWNLNILWGLAWPEIMDDFSACLAEYARNGKLLPRGACVGGYSFIMTGNPATNMLTSAYMKGLITKVKDKELFALIKQNHMPGGMMSYESADDLKFYIENGWCPGNAGKTLEWAYQDWALAQMAKKLGKNKDAIEFERRASGWKILFNKEQGLIFPKDKDGNWVHTDPLNGNGWIEANAWQATWEVSHDLPALAKMMGGNEVMAKKLNHAFEQAATEDFVHGYSHGYVSYANQPGCSNAHVFNHIGASWMTQYWVRRVNEQAYGGITPDKGYGGHDEDQGQMGGVSSLMSMGLFNVKGNQELTPQYDITSPIFEEVTIKLNPKYYEGQQFVIRTYNNSMENCYIQSAKLNGEQHNSFSFSHEQFQKGGVLELWLDKQPNTSWGIDTVNIN